MLRWFSIHIINAFKILYNLTLLYLLNPLIARFRNRGIEPKLESTDQEYEKEYFIEVTDEFYCEYDSTWETNSSGTEETSRQSRRHGSHRFAHFRNASRDMQNYRRDYPGQYRHDCWRYKEDDMPNLEFYLGKKESRPDGFSIDGFHKEWFGDYLRLERVHSFIQWLFPLQEQGMNYQAFQLTKEEIQAFKKNPTAKEKLLKSYKLMLDFYGIELSNETTGEVKRAPKWQIRFDNLNRNTHNNLRITRILKCLGTLGYPHFQAPLVRFFLEETLVHHSLPNVQESVLNYFMFTVLDKQERRKLIKYAYMKSGQSEFVWCPKKIQVIWGEEFSCANRKHGCTNSEVTVNLEHDHGSVRNSSLRHSTGIENNAGPASNANSCKGSPEFNKEVNGNESETAEIIPFTEIESAKNIPFIDCETDENILPTESESAEKKTFTLDKTAENNPFTEDETARNIPLTESGTAENNPFTEDETARNIPLTESGTAENIPFTESETADNIPFIESETAKKMQHQVPFGSDCEEN